MTTESSVKSKPNSTTSADPPVCFDVPWLAGQKSKPNPLPSREQYQQLRTLGQLPRKRSRKFINILASFLAVGLCCSIGYGLHRSGWFNLEPPTTPVAKDNTNLTPEEQRQANETIEAILALQELAAQSESNSATQKR
jgi:hypothetical protein